MAFKSAFYDEGRTIEIESEEPLSLHDLPDYIEKLIIRNTDILCLNLSRNYLGRLELIDCSSPDENSISLGNVKEILFSSDLAGQALPRMYL